jgi:hypothetical protein
MELVAHLRLSKQAWIDLVFFCGVPSVLALLSTVLGPYVAIMGGAGATVYVLSLAIARVRASVAWLPIPGRPYMSAPRWGHVAEWLRNGLQNRVHQFNSGRGLHPYNQWLRPII